MFVFICSNCCPLIHSSVLTQKNHLIRLSLFLWPLCFMNAVNCFYEWKIKSLLYTSNCSEIKNILFLFKLSPDQWILVFLAKNIVFPQEFSARLLESTLVPSGRFWTLLRSSENKKQDGLKTKHWINFNIGIFSVVHFFIVLQNRFSFYLKDFFSMIWFIFLRHLLWKDNHWDSAVEYVLFFMNIDC